jgi:hypothetical protein
VSGRPRRAGHPTRYEAVTHGNGNCTCWMGPPPWTYPWPIPPREGRPPAGAPWCATCGGTGLVLRDRQIEDGTVPAGARRLTVAYRCDCLAGELVSEAFARVPRHALPGPER